MSEPRPAPTSTTAAAVAIDGARGRPAPGPARPTSPPAARPLATEADRTAFADGHYAGMHAWMWWLTGDADAAADLTQDVFAAFWSSLERVRVRHPRAWLYRIGRNRWRVWCRERERTRVRSAAPADVEPDDTAAPDNQPAAAGADAELLARVRAAVANLPHAYREAVTLRYWSELGHAEIGRVLGIPGPLARWRVHHGRALLRAAIDPDGASS